MYITGIFTHLAAEKQKSPMFIKGKVDKLRVSAQLWAV